MYIGYLVYSGPLCCTVDLCLMDHCVYWTSVVHWISIYWTYLWYTLDLIFIGPPCDVQWTSGVHWTSGIYLTALWCTLTSLSDLWCTLDPSECTLDLPVVNTDLFIGPLVYTGPLCGCTLDLPVVYLCLSDPGGLAE